MMIPLPVRVLVIVKVLEPVSNWPRVMFTVGTLILLTSVTVLDDELLLIVSALKVVAPVIVEFAVPAKVIVLVPAVKVPLFTKLE